LLGVGQPAGSIARKWALSNCYEVDGLSEFVPMISAS
jgi:hypothetical protein